MQQKSTTFENMYQSLVAQITAGRIPYGGRLPSASMLCEIYCVGIRTARAVINALREEGYIATRERCCPVVIYQGETASGDMCAIRAVLERREAILEVFDAMELLMPALFVISARQCGEEDFRELERPAKKVLHISSKEGWRLSSSVLNHILLKSQNPLFHKLYTSMEVFCQVPVFAGHCDPYEAAREENRDFFWVIEPLWRRSEEEAQQNIRIMYRKVKIAISAYLEDLAREHPDVAANPACGFRWDAARGREYRYAEVSRRLIDGIFYGVWKNGDYLPPANELAETYGVSLYTVRQALGLLEDRRMIRVRNGRGAQVTLSRIGEDVTCFSNSAQKRDAMTYLYALQLMVLTLRPAVELAFGEMGEQAHARMVAGLELGGNAAMQIFCDCVLDASPSSTLRVIFQELNRLILWGRHFMFQPAAKVSGQYMQERCKEALCCFENGDREGFATQLTECYCRAYRGVREFLIHAGIPEAKKLAPIAPLER